MSTRRSGPWQMSRNSTLCAFAVCLIALSGCALGSRTAPSYSGKSIAINTGLMLGGAALIAVSTVVIVHSGTRLECENLRGDEKSSEIGSVVAGSLGALTGTVLFGVGAYNLLPCLQCRGPQQWPAPPVPAQQAAAKSLSESLHRARATAQVP